jgi:hypothetical protein
VDKLKSMCGFAEGARVYVSWVQARGERRLRQRVSGGEAVERKGTGVQEAGADDAVEETYSPTRPECVTMLMAGEG